MIARDDVTGLVLAGGRGQRMGGVDKGLQPWRGMPLVRRALDRLSPQVGLLMISANRHLDEYAAFGLPVWADETSGYPGPLAGMLAGLDHCHTEWLVTVPCDAPRFPGDLVARLAKSVKDDTDIACAATRQDDEVRLEPVFCLMRRSTRATLAAFLSAGERKTERWIRSLRYSTVVFDDAAAFANMNTPDDFRSTS